MGRSTEYYRTHPEARPEQKAKRRELDRKNYKTDKLKGKGLKYKSRSANRG